MKKVKSYRRCCNSVKMKMKMLHRLAVGIKKKMKKTDRGIRKKFINYKLFFLHCPQLIFIVKLSWTKKVLNLFHPVKVNNFNRLFSKSEHFFCYLFFPTTSEMRSICLREYSAFLEYLISHILIENYFEI